MNVTKRADSRFALRLTGTALLASLSLTLLAGCGGSGNNHNVNGGLGGSTGGTSAGAFANKSFVTPSLELGSNQSGTLTVAVGTDAATIAGTLNLAIAAVSTESKAATRATGGSTTYSIPLSGTFNPTSGAFSLKGILSRGTATYNVVATGTLNATGTSGGTTAITINNTTYTSTFNSGTTLSGTLSADYFPLTYNPNQVYQETTATDNETPSTSTVTGYSFLGGFRTPLGATTITTLNGTTVNKVAELDSSTTGTVLGYYYYTLANSALTVYGFDDTSSDGSTSATSRFSPPYTLPLTLTAGQAYTQTVNVTYAQPGVSTSQTDTFTTGLTFNDFEQITIPAGTYTAAKVTVTSNIAIPASSTSGGGSNVTTSTIYLVKGLGVVQEHDVFTATYTQTGSTTPTTSTYTDDYILTSTSAGETRSAHPAAGATHRAAPGLFGILRASHL